MGGGPHQFPDRYAAANPVSPLPIGATIYLVHGQSDGRVPWQQSRDFAVQAQDAADAAEFVPVEGCGHFEVIDPLSSAWPTVLAAFQTAAARLGRT